MARKSEELSKRIARKKVAPVRYRDYLGTSIDVDELGELDDTFKLGAIDPPTTDPPIPKYANLNMRRVSQRLTDSGTLRNGACKFCKKRFSTIGSLKLHLKVHSTREELLCKENGHRKLLLSSKSSAGPVLKGKAESCHVCPVCQKTLSSAVSLREHRNIHADNREFRCDLCSKSFRHYSVLSRHKVCHSDARPFQCSECSERFATKVYLQSHMKKHSADRKHVCPKCGRGFTHSHVLKRHLHVHDDARPFGCGKCGQTFADNGSRLRHQREHSSAALQACKLCGDTFKRATLLKRHILRKHPQEQVVITQLGPSRKLSFYFPIPADEDFSGDEPTDSQLSYLVMHKPVVALRVSNPGAALALGQSPFTSCPDFSSQDYYVWLSRFTESLAALAVPLEKSVYGKVNHVHMAICDVMAEATGILANKENFNILMSTANKLHRVLENHQQSVYKALESSSRHDGQLAKQGML